MASMEENDSFIPTIFERHQHWPQFNDSITTVYRASINININKEKGKRTYTKKIK